MKLDIKDNKQYIVPVFLIISFLLLVKKYLLVGIWFDEATSLMFFISKGPNVILTKYIPNNHVLYNLIFWAYGNVIGGFYKPELLLRLPSMLFMFASFFTVIFFFKDILKKDEKLLYLSLLVSSHILLSFSCQIRGYSLSVLTAVFGLLFILRDRNIKDMLLYAFTGSVSIAVMPTNYLLFFILGCYKIVFGKKEPLLKYLFYFLSPLSGLIIYSMILDELMNRIRFMSFTDSLLHTLIIFKSTFGGMLRDIIPLIICIVITVFYLIIKKTGVNNIGIYKKTIKLFIVLFGVPFIIIFLLRLGIFDRNLLIFIPVWMFFIVKISIKFFKINIANYSSRIVMTIVIILPVISYFTEKNIQNSIQKMYKEQNISYQYYNKNSFRPKETIKYVKDNYGTDTRIITDDSDFMSLKYYTVYFKSQNIFNYRSLNEKKFFDLKKKYKLLLIVKNLFMIEKLFNSYASNKKIDVDLVKDFGYFKVYEIN